MKILSNLSFITLFFVVFCVNVTNAQTKPTAKAKPKPKAVAVANAKVASGVIKAKAAPSTQLKTELDSLSYAIGVNVGGNLRSQKLNVNAEILAMGVKDAIASNNGLMSNDACGAFIQAFFQKNASKEGDVNKAKGDTFLAQNKVKEGVMTLPSGLQYKVVTEGTGAKPIATDNVKVHYHGTLIDGTVFDSSVNRGEPATFGVTQVIKGWVEALQLMNTGSKWTLYIPADLAYGMQGPPAIGPNQTLVFDVELIEIVKQ